MFAAYEGVAATPLFLVVLNLARLESRDDRMVKMRRFAGWRESVTALSLLGTYYILLMKHTLNFRCREFQNHAGAVRYAIASNRSLTISNLHSWRKWKKIK